MMNTKAKYKYVCVEYDRVFIEDLDTGKSITNDADAVVRAINQQHPRRRIVYKDTTGRWDELLHEDGCFAGFAHYTERLPNSCPSA